MIKFPVSRHYNADMLPDGIGIQGIRGHPLHQDHVPGGDAKIETHEPLCHSMSILFFLAALQSQYISFGVLRMFTQSLQRPKTSKPI